METWGESKTQFFFSLTPDAILQAIESEGFSLTGRCVQLNSLENRVYDIELAEPVDGQTNLITKFYRPGRWTKEQILEEHRFLEQLDEEEVPVVKPVQFSSGSTLASGGETGIFFCLFPKFGGRIPDEISEGEAEQLGRLLARTHAVGSKEDFQHRITIGVKSYARDSLDYLFESETIPQIYEAAYEDAVETICELSEPWFQSFPQQRLHGDCHRGNLLNPGTGQFHIVDFDDSVTGPVVQDLWLLIAGRDELSLEIRESLLNGYEQMRPFNREELILVEPLRALRMVHFSAWIAHRWEDPAFKKTFPEFGSDKYWREELDALREQLYLVQNVSD